MKSQLSFYYVLCVLCVLCGEKSGTAQDTTFDAKLFEGHADVGNVNISGSAEFHPAKKEWRITAAGENVWGKEDAFHFAWRKISSDLTIGADIGFVGVGKNAHRKAGPMVRQGLEADAAYVGASIHGDGLITLHYRKEKGAPTLDVRAPFKGPGTIKLERRGDVFALSVATPGHDFQPVAALTVKLTGLVHAGFFACSHETDHAETATFSGISWQNIPATPGQKRVQETSLEVIDIDTGARKIVYRARERFEAPNWSRDGKLFFVNRGGAMYTLPTQGGSMTKLDTGNAVGCNNDHGLSPDGQWLAISHGKGGSQISVLPSNGGTPRQLTFAKEPSYWHGWSPDGETLLFCGQRNKEFDIYSIGVDGKGEKQLTTAPGLDDGPEYTPDGKKIYFNSDRSGDMKIWRMNADGTGQEQVTKDAGYADWFPHPSPDGKWLVFLSYDKNVTGHPANQDVALRIMPLAGGKARVLTTLFGGQGTMNVPSWSPDSKQIAFVSYLLVLPAPALDVNTFSIVAHDPDKKEWGVAVASRVIAVGSVVPWAKAGVGAVATQAQVNVAHGPNGLELFAKGMNAEEALAALADSDKRIQVRQLGLVDAKGMAAALTGKECNAYAGHKIGKNYTCQGNILAGEDVINDMAKAFEETNGPLAWRMMAALESADKAGGDKRGKQSAAILVVRDKAGPNGVGDRYIDLRVDEHKEPIPELARILNLRIKKPKAAPAK